MAQWVCPCCHSGNLDYGAVRFEDDACYFPRVCQDCKCVWEEWYWLEFSWHYNLFDKDGNEILSDDEDENE